VDSNTLGQLAYQIDFDGNKSVFTYDGLGRLGTKTTYLYPNLTTAYETVTYAYNQNYDAQGDYHNTVTSSLTGTTDSECDVNGNLIKITSPQGTVNYAYDLATGNKIEVWTANTDIHYAYDQAGELTTVTVTKLDGQTLSPPLVTTYGYDLDGNLVSTQNANGTTETRSFDLLNRLTSIVDRGALGVRLSG
jgi:YD repeat-containing protein